MDIVLKAFLLVLAISLDAFVSSLSYGAARIRIPPLSFLLLNLICSGTLALALTLGHFLGQWMSPQTATWLCVILLGALGLLKLFDSALKSLIRRRGDFEKQIRFSFSELRFILRIYADPAEADRDHSRSLSPGEAVFLAIALSFDSLAVGLGAGLTHPNPLLVVLLSFLVGCLAIGGGCYLGKKISQGHMIDLGWLSGLLLLSLALFKLG